MKGKTLSIVVRYPDGRVRFTIPYPVPENVQRLVADLLPGDLSSRPGALGVRVTLCEKGHQPRRVRRIIINLTDGQPPDTFARYLAGELRDIRIPPRVSWAA